MIIISIGGYSLFALSLVLSLYFRQRKERRMEDIIKGWHPCFKSSAEEQAWKLLARLLTRRQKVHAALYHSVKESGKYGYYSIPVFDRAKIRFIPKYTRPIKFALALMEVARTYNRDVVKMLIFPRMICLSNTGLSLHAPWYDSVATFVLHIQSGDELELFRQGNVGW